MNRVSVLVVEDELLIALDIETILEEAGYSVLGPVKSASAALEKIASTGADLALLDVNLETGNTFPVADVLSERGIPFIFMTGHTQTAFPQQHRARPILNKPCRPGHLIEALAELQGKLRAGHDVSHRPATC